MNELYPIFLKAHQLDILIVGGGNVALEKLHFLLKSSPQAKVSLVAINFIPEIQEMISLNGFPHKVKPYDSSDLDNRLLVIGATDDEQVNQKIYQDAKSKKILVNIADCPDYCDFYMGGIVTKGHLKLAISTNGKSPTMAKRLRQFFEAFLPENINDLLDNLNAYRKTLKGDFGDKVTELNKLTESILQKK